MMIALSKSVGDSFEKGGEFPTADRNGASYCYILYNLANFMLPKRSFGLLKSSLREHKLVTKDSTNQSLEPVIKGTAVNHELVFLGSFVTTWQDDCKR
jgi:hypothetical protein